MQLLLTGCVSGDSASIAIEEGELVAAAFLELTEGGRLRSVVPLQVHEGRVSGVISAREGSEPVRLATVARSELVGSAFGLDPSRLDEARIVPRRRDAACAGEGEIDDGWTSLDLGSRAKLYEYESESRAFRVQGGALEFSASVLAELSLLVPARGSFECEEKPRLEVVPAFTHGALVRAGDLLGDQEVGSHGMEAVEFLLLSDGRMVGSTARFLVLRRPDAPFRDDPREVLRIDAPGAEDHYLLRGGVHVREDPGTGHGELWFLSTTQGAGGRRPRLEAVRFSPLGFEGRRVLSEFDPGDDVLRMGVDTSGAVLALLRAGGIWHTPRPEGPWTSFDPSASSSRLLEPVPGRGRAFFSADARGPFYLQRPEEGAPDAAPMVSLLGESVGTLAKVTGGFALRDRAGDLRLGFSGEGGLLFLGHGLGPEVRWTRLAPDIAAATGRPCAGATSCGRSPIRRTLWDVHPIEVDGEAWLLMAIDLCEELIVLRLSDGCTTGLPAPPRAESDADLRAQLPRWLFSRAGRLFVARHAGAIDEIRAR